MRIPPTFLYAGVLFVSGLGSMPQVVEACVVTYTDSTVHTGESKVIAWAFAEDYFDEYACGGFAWGYWEHTYEAAVHISSPTQNWAYDFDEMPNVSYGGGSAWAYASVSYTGDPGDYKLNWWIWIWCSVVEYFVDEFLTGQVNAGGAGPTCSGEPAAMAAEYQSGVVYTPGPTPALQCDDFKFFPRTMRLTAHFTWDELNGRFDNGNPHSVAGVSGWGYIEPVALAKLQGTRNGYGMGIVVTSGYRCPAGNVAVGGVIDSYHMQGRSFDLRKEGGTPQPPLSNYWNQQEFAELKAFADALMPLESGNWNDYTSPDDRHYHVTF